jgi:hypothetical protein
LKLPWKAVINKLLSSVLLAASACLPVAAWCADPQRLDDVARRGAEVMPFDLKATTHVFTKTPDGGVQSVVAKHPQDLAQVRLIRSHLKDIEAQFRKGDFSGPSHIHGQDMPGLAQLQAAPPGRIRMAYAELPDGAQLTYSTKSPDLVAALHAWFDAQLGDHGADAMAGHRHAQPMPGAAR